MREATDLRPGHVIRLIALDQGCSFRYGRLIHVYIHVDFPGQHTIIHMIMYHTCCTCSTEEEVPVGDYELPLSKAEILEQGAVCKAVLCTSIQIRLCQHALCVAIATGTLYVHTVGIRKHVHLHVCIYKISSFARFSDSGRGSACSCHMAVLLYGCSVILQHYSMLPVCCYVYQWMKYMDQSVLACTVCY